MPKTYTGINIGTYSVKLAQVTDSKIENLVTDIIPNGLVKDDTLSSTNSMAEYLGKLTKQLGTKNKDAAIVLSSDQSFSRRITMPYMDIQQLKLNLPYEFHDYIQYNKGAYNYDYAVLGTIKNENGDIESLDILAAAVSNETISMYKEILKKCGLKLSLALPENLTYRNIIRKYQSINEVHPKEYCIIDMGHSAIRMHMYNGSSYNTTRVLEYGGLALDHIIANHLDIDVSSASEQKIKNLNNVHTLDVCIELYNKIAIELLRALNFYHYNNLDSSINDIYFCGGLVKIDALMDIIRSTLDVNIHNISDLMPDYSGSEKDNIDMASAAIGITMQ